MIFTSKYNTRIPEVPVHEAVLVGSPEDAEALIDGVNGDSYTYLDVERLMEAIGSGLTRQGISKGDVVAFYAPNSPQYVLGMLGCFSIGAVFTGVNNNYKEFELGHHLSDCKAKTVITVTANLPTLDSVLASEDHDTSCVQSVIIVDAEVDNRLYFGNLMTDDGSVFPRGLTYNLREDLAAIMYSSGTTGLPKGVMLTHYNLVAGITGLRSSTLHTDEKLVPLIFLPMFHIFGVLLMLLAFARRGTAVILAGFKPDVFLAAIQKYKTSHLYLVPPVVHFLSKHPMVDKYDLSSLNMVFSAAAPLTASTEKTFLERFKMDSVYQAYGMTESASAVVFEPMGKACSGSSGTVLPNVQIKVVDLVTRKMLGVGEDGEICLRGPQMMKGYLNRPEATAATMEDDWLITGDIGHFNEDEYLFITGRVKELIKHKGFQVAPAELEGLLLTHSKVTDAAVLGVPDEAAGELPRAFIVRKAGSELSEEEICDFIKERLSRHKWLSGGVQFVEEIPKTASGKIVRREVKKLMKLN